jgi:hypothetical protein
MTRDEYRTWQLLWLIHNNNEAVARLPGAPLDLHIWFQRYMQRLPAEFASKDWSSHQPAIRKIHLMKEEVQ